MFHVLFCRCVSATFNNLTSFRGLRNPFLIKKRKKVLCSFFARKRSYILPECYCNKPNDKRKRVSSIEDTRLDVMLISHGDASLGIIVHHELMVSSLIT